MVTQTTKLDDLPISSHTDSNIKLEIDPSNVKINSIVNDAVKEREEIHVGNQVPLANRNQDDMNNFANSVQQVASAGTLELQSRDIPQNQSHLTQDAETQPSFVPASVENDYIGNIQTQNDMIQCNNIKQTNEKRIDDIYNNIQTPLLLAVLYFVYQLPVVKVTTLKYIPSLFRKDGNPNLVGYIANSVSFACLFYALTMTLEYFSL